METIGWAALQVIPTMRGVEGQMTDALVGPARQAGSAAGRAAGQGMASGLEAAQAAVSKASEKVAGARDKEADAAGKVRVAEAKLQELRDKGNASASQLAAAEERLATANRNSDRAAGARVQAVTDLAQARARAANAADEGEESTRRWGGSLDGLGDKLKGGVDDLGKFAIAAAGIGSAIGLGMQAMDNMDVESKLAAQLGATGDLAAEYGDTAGSLYKQGLTDSMGEAADAVAAVASTFKVAGFEGERSIDEIAESALAFSGIFGTDVNESVQSANQLITQGLAKDSTEAFDLMTAAYQRTGTAMRDELPELMNEYGTFFSSLGFDGQEAFGLLVNASDQGKIAMDKVGDALKETGIRATDIGDQAAQDALKGIGLNATETANRLLAGGDVAKQAYGEMVDGLLQIQDPAKQAEAAVALFGTPLEDLNKEQIPAFLQAMSGAGDAMAGFEGSAQQSADTLNSGPNHALTELKNTVQGGLTEALGWVAQWMMNNQGVTQAMGVAIGILAAGFVAAKVGIAGYAVAQGIAAAATGAGAASLAGNTLALTGYAIASGAARVATVASTAAQWLLNAALSANPIGLVIAAVAALVAGLVWFFTQTETGQQIVSAAWSAIKTGWDAMWSSVSAGLDAFGAALGWVGDKAGEVKDWIVTKWNELVGFVTGLPGKISSAAAGMWDGIKNAFRGAINWIISKWNSFQLVIGGQKVSVLGMDIDIPTITLNTPDIPMLASGGVAGRRSDGTLWGPGTGTSDSILGVDAFGMPTARVSSGEGVVKKSAMDSGGGDFVAALNAGWVPPADLLHAMVPGYADGGAVVSPDEVVNFAKGVEGAEYVWGGVNWGDCSGAVSAVANFATGRAPFGSRFATGNEGAELAARGFQSGLGPAGSLQAGWFNGGPYGGHTAITLPNGVNFEMGGARGNGQYGGQAAGANDPSFTDHAHLTMISAAAMASLQPSVSEYETPSMSWGDDPAASAPTSGANPSTGIGAVPGVATTPAAPQQTFSARERFKQWGSDIGGIWADSAVEIFGLGDAFALADRYTIKADQTSTATMATPTTGENGVDGDPNIIPWLSDINSLLKGTGLFDTGGWLMPGQLGFNGLVEPEAVLRERHWDIAESNIDKVDELVGAGARTGGGGNTYITNATFRDEGEYYRQQAQSQRLSAKQYLGRWS